VRAGHTRRQTPVELGRPLKFPAEVACCNEIQVDILAILGRAKLELEPASQRYVLQLEPKCEGPTMSCEVEVRRAQEAQGCCRNGMKDQAAVSRSNNQCGAKPTGHSAARRHEAALSAQRYMEQHCMEQVVQTAMKATVSERPNDPFTHLAKQLLKTAADLKLCNNHDDGLPKERENALTLHAPLPSWDEAQLRPSNDSQQVQQCRAVTKTWSDASIMSAEERAHVSRQISRTPAQHKDVIQSGTESTAALGEPQLQHVETVAKENLVTSTPVQEFSNYSDTCLRRAKGTLPPLSKPPPLPQTPCASTSEAEDGEVLGETESEQAAHLLAMMSLAQAFHCVSADARLEEVAADTTQDSDAIQTAFGHANTACSDSDSVVVSEVTSTMCTSTACTSVHGNVAGVATAGVVGEALSLAFPHAKAEKLDPELQDISDNGVPNPMYLQYEETQSIGCVEGASADLNTTGPAGGSTDSASEGSGAESTSAKNDGLDIEGESIDSITEQYSQPGTKSSVSMPSVSEPCVVAAPRPCNARAMSVVSSSACTYDQQLEDDDDSSANRCIKDLIHETLLLGDSVPEPADSAPPVETIEIADLKRQISTALTERASQGDLEQFLRQALAEDTDSPSVLGRAEATIIQHRPTPTALDSINEDAEVERIRRDLRLGLEGAAQRGELAALIAAVPAS